MCTAPEGDGGHNRTSAHSSLGCWQIVCTPSAVRGSYFSKKRCSPLKTKLIAWSKCRVTFDGQLCVCWCWTGWKLRSVPSHSVQIKILMLCASSHGERERERKREGETWIHAVFYTWLLRIQAAPSFSLTHVGSIHILLFEAEPDF